MKVFYHTDNDGFLSAAIIYNFATGGKDAEYFPCNYDGPLPYHAIEQDEEIWIVDYHIPPVAMENLLEEKTENVVWIDHHGTNIDKYKDFPVQIIGIRDTKFSGCLLTWLFVNGRTVEDFLAAEKKGESWLPRAVRLVDDWDTWGHGTQPSAEAKLFHAGTQANDTNPKGEFWRQCMDVTERKVSTTMDEGAIVLGFKSKHAEAYCKSNLFYTAFEGCRCAVLNVGLAGRDWFNSIDQRNIDILIAIIFNGDQWTCTLYGNNKDIHVGELAKKYGGGGHPGAAGFSCKELPFQKINFPPPVEGVIP